MIDTPLSMLFQKSVIEEALPLQCIVKKLQWLEPFPRKASKYIMGNYRPVTLRLVICKLMESILRDELVDHINRNNLSSNDQHGSYQGETV